MIVAFTGVKTVGKDFLADALGVGIGAKKYSFAGPLKAIVNDLFPWVPVDMESEDKEKVIDHPANVNGWTPRAIWKEVSDILRGIDNHVFFNRFINDDFKRMLIDHDTLHIITDMRFEHEHRWMMEQNIPIIKIESDVIYEHGFVPHALDVYAHELEPTRLNGIVCLFHNDHTEKSTNQWLRVWESNQFIETLKEWKND